MTAPKRFQLSPARFGLILAAAIAVVVVIFHRDLIHSLRGPDLLISEVMAVNRSTLVDSDGDYSDWIEIYNPHSQARNLGGWFLTDNFREPRKWAFPPLELRPGGFLVVYASGKNRTNRIDDLHTNFRLNPRGEYLALIKPDGRTVAHEYLPKYPPMDGDMSFGLRASWFSPRGDGLPSRDIRQYAYFVAATPGAPNGVEMRGRVADTKFSVRRGFFSDPVDVTISSATPDAEILFTTDGSTPRPGHGTRHVEPIHLRGTTILRAAAFKENYRPTDVDTHTFIFPRQVVSQTGAGFPATWGERDGAPVVADYEMDQEIAQDPRYQERLDKSLLAIPTLSVVLDQADLFDPATGIYSNPLETGASWERPASVELIYPNGARGFHVNCGLRIQGGWSRRPEESPKHSFRLEFRERYGSAYLNYPLLGHEGPKRLDSLVLRAGCNNSWLHWSADERRRGELMRDEFMRDSYHELGHPSARGRFFHLYLNGLYWGIYNACERPEASFLAEELGSTPADYESRNASKVLSGSEEVWNRIFELANAGLEDPARYREIRKLVDIDAFCSFMLVQIYGGTADWDAASNWYAGRRIRPPGKYRFFIWDSERSLEEIDANILAADDDRSPTRLFQALRKNLTFREAFRTIAQKNLGPDGALSAEATARRFALLTDTLRPAIVAESARWGDYRRDVHPYREGPYELYTVDDHWQPEVDRLLQRYFPARTQAVVSQLKKVGLY